MSARLLLLTAPLGFCLVALPARAQEPRREATIRLEVDPALTARGCPAADALAPSVEAHLGRPIGAGSGATDLVLEARDDSSEGISAILTLRWTDGEALGTRRIQTEDRSCRTLAEGLPLVIAMMADLYREEATLRLLEHQAAPPAPAAGEPEPAEPTAAEPPPSKRPVGLSLWIGASVDLGTFPEPALRPDAQLRLHVGDLTTVGLTVGFIAPQRQMQAPQEGVELWGATGGLASCFGGRLGPMRLSGCGELEAGWVRSTGLGFALPQRAEALHLAVVLGPRLVFRAGAFRVSLELGASIPLVGQRFTFLVGDSERELFSSAPVTFRAALRIGLRTPDLRSGTSP